jgi:WD40 repeat protein
VLKIVVATLETQKGKFLQRTGPRLLEFQLHSATGACELTLTGHTEGVNDVSWSPDGSYVASASDDGSVRLWETAGGACLRTLVGHAHYVFCVAFSPRTAHVATASFDETVKLWCPRTGVCLRTLPAHSDPVTALAFDAPGRKLLTASFDGLVRMWCPDTGRCLRTLMPATSSPAPIGGACFNRNGALLVSAALDGRVRLWRDDRDAPLNCYRGHAAGGYCSSPALVTYGKPVPPISEWPKRASRTEGVAATTGIPPQDTALGGEIFIHGGGTGSDWTLGCIALADARIDWLFAAAGPGTVVVIAP